MSRGGDEQWQRPDPSAHPGEGERDAAAYPGPPGAVPPPPGWRPAVQRHPTPPRRLPDIDHEAVDLAEERADRFTNALGIAAGVILIVVACVQWRT